MDNKITSEIIDHVGMFPHHLQKQVLDYVIKLRSNHEVGVSGERLLRFAGSIPSEDLKIMSDAIKSDCGRIER